jgi:sugar/nucleoside kinase (ribokinase family)
MPKVISIGNTCLDIILSGTDHLPRWNSEIIFPASQWRLGGQGVNFAIATALMGMKPLLVSSIGTDMIGNQIWAELFSVRSIDKRFVRREFSATGYSVTIIHRDGERSFLTFLGHQSLFSMRPIMHDLVRIIEEGDIIHVSGLYMLRRFESEFPATVKKLRSAGARISFDPGWNPDGFTAKQRGTFFASLSQVDFYEPNDSELMQLSGTSRVAGAITEVRRRFPGVLAVKLGKKGSMIIDTAGRETLVESYRTHAIDTTGAGDVFDAGFVLGIFQNRSLEDSAKIGNAAASIAVSKSGKATFRFPKFSEVQTLIHNH